VRFEMTKIVSSTLKKRSSLLQRLRCTLYPLWIRLLGLSLEACGNVSMAQTQCDQILKDNLIGFSQTKNQTFPYATIETS
jgi:hypothetical protein